MQMEHFAIVTVLEALFLTLGKLTSSASVFSTVDNSANRTGAESIRYSLDNSSR